MPIDLNHPERHPVIERLFIEASGRGLRHVGPDDVRAVATYLSNHTVRGNDAVDAPGAGIDAIERRDLEAILRSEQWQRLFAPPATLALQRVLLLDEAAVRVAQPAPAGEWAPVGSVPGNRAWRIPRNVGVADLVRQFNADYAKMRATRFERPTLSLEERGAAVYFLLQDYAKALERCATGAAVDRARVDLLRAYFDKPAAAYWGARDSSGDRLGNAAKLVFGTDPNHADTEFDIDRNRAWVDYQSMSGSFDTPAARIDEWKRRQGLAPDVSAFERMSPLNWIVGDIPGNTKPSCVFEEARAIKTTGVDFARVMLGAAAAKLAGRHLDPQFDMKVSFLDRSLNFVSIDPAEGERLVPVHDRTGERLKVRIERVGDAQWRPEVVDSTGATVAPQDYTAVMLDAKGKVKEAGKADKSYVAYWWGLCDVNAAQQLLTVKYGFPRPGRAVTCDGVMFEADDIAAIVGRRLPEIIPTETAAGERFDGEPDQVWLVGGGDPLLGKIETPVEFYAPDTDRFGNVMTLQPRHANFPHGQVRIRDESGVLVQIDADAIIDVSRRSHIPGGDRDRLDTLRIRLPGDAAGGVGDADGVRVVRGELLTPLRFPGRHRRMHDGSHLAMIVASKRQPILGELEIDLQDGTVQHVPVRKIAQIMREDPKDVTAIDALFYILRNKGIFCADTDPGPSVCNGVRLVEVIRGRWTTAELLALRAARDRGETVPPDICSFDGDLSQLKGIRGKVCNPDNLLFMSLGERDSSYSALRFWIEMDANRVPINCGTVQGQWDFLWSLEGEPDWDRPATLNPKVPNALVKRLYVNSIDNPEAAAHLLWPGWRDDLLPSPARLVAMGAAARAEPGVAASAASAASAAGAAPMVVDSVERHGMRRAA